MPPSPNVLAHTKLIGQALKREPVCLHSDTTERITIIPHHGGHKRNFLPWHRALSSCLPWWWWTSRGHSSSPLASRGSCTGAVCTTPATQTQKKKVWLIRGSCYVLVDSWQWSVLQGHQLLVLKVIIPELGTTKNKQCLQCFGNILRHYVKKTSKVSCLKMTCLKWWTSNCVYTSQLEPKWASCQTEHFLHVFYQQFFSKAGEVGLVNT